MNTLTPGSARSGFEAVGGAIVLLDTEGTVVGWTQAAQRLVGYSAAEVVGRPAAVLLASGADPMTSSEFSEPGGAPHRWPDSTKVRHRDGHGIDVRLRVQALVGQDDRARWIVAAIDAAALSSWTAGGSVMEPCPLDLRLPSTLPIGVVIRDTRLRCTWVNDTQGSRDGIAVDQRLGRTLSEAAPGTEAETLEALMYQVLESGVPVLNAEYGPFAPMQVREVRALAASFFRLDDAEGVALGVCAVSVDVTEGRRARERLAILGGASKRIGTTLDVMRTGQELADLAVPFADFVTVDLADSAFSLGEEPLALPGSQDVGVLPALRRAGLASIHQEVPESLTARGEPVFVSPASPFSSVLRSGKSHFEPTPDTSPPDTVPGTRMDRQLPAWARKIHDRRKHSSMVVPIRARGAVLGVAAFVRTGDSPPFEEDDLLLAEELAGWAALCLDNARQYARERAAALALQRHLLPHRAPGGSAADLAWRYLPADDHHGVGGDWFDAIQLSGARVALVVGDVVGHGINAAAAMGRLRTAVRTLAEMDMPPDELLAHLDELVIRHLAEADENTLDPATATMAATCLYAVYDPVTRRCTMALAGHPPPAIIDPHGGVTFPDLPTGAPLGVGLVPFESVELELPESSVLALYTDGLIEARGHDIGAGMERLRTALARPGLPLEELCSSVVDTLPSEASRDDVTLLLARTRALDPGQVASCEFPAEPYVVSSARSLATAQLTWWGLEEQTAATELIVSELVTNAIRHGTGPIQLRLILDDVLTCEVHDTSHCAPSRRRPLTTDENGRGLLLVDRLSGRWGTRCTPDGKLVWSEQELAPAS
ncbi:SpoIIE family protein phosphatase [Streptomyces sp. NPDC091376]|uniref:SpoIIE family protein phosphatase n=1 Tax=Streptomyces sp. NPDC091376 TaxID=3365994 RepID=UPI00382AFA3A